MAKLLKVVLRQKWITVVLWLLCIGGGTVVIFQQLPKDFIPPGDSGCAYGVMMTPMGSSSEDMDDLQLQVESIIMGEYKCQKCADSG